MEKSEIKQDSKFLNSHALWGFVLAVVSFIFIVWNLLAYAWLLPLYNDSACVAVDIENKLEKSVDLLQEYELFNKDDGKEVTAYKLVSDFLKDLDEKKSSYNVLHTQYVALYRQYVNDETKSDGTKVTEEDLDKKIADMQTSYSEYLETERALYTYIQAFPYLLKYTKEYLEKDLAVNNFIMIKDNVYNKVFKDAGSDVLTYWEVLDQYIKDLNKFTPTEKPFTYKDYKGVLDLSVENIIPGKVSELATRFNKIVDTVNGYASALSANSTNYFTATRIIGISTMVYNSAFGVILLCYWIFMLVERKKNK